MRDTQESERLSHTIHSRWSHLLSSGAQPGALHCEKSLCSLGQCELNGEQFPLGVEPLGPVLPLLLDESRPLSQATVLPWKMRSLGNAFVVYLRINPSERVRGI